MAARAKAIVRGDREIIRNMRRLPQAVSGKNLDVAARGSLEPMRQQTQDNARPLRNYVGKYSDFFPQPYKARKGGHLDQGVVVVKRDSPTVYQRVFWLSFKGRARKIAHLAEFGSLPHLQPNFKGGWMHPGASPHPFARPAYESTKNDVPADMGRILWPMIVGSLIGRRR